VGAPNWSCMITTRKGTSAKSVVKSTGIVWSVILIRAMSADRATF